MSTLQTEPAGQNNSKILPVKIKIGFSPLFSTFFSFFLLAGAYIFQRAEGLDQLMLYLQTLTQSACYWGPTQQAPSCRSAAGSLYGCGHGRITQNRHSTVHVYKYMLGVCKTLDIIFQLFTVAVFVDFCARFPRFHWRKNLCTAT